MDKNSIAKYIGQKIQEHRKANDITQEELGVLLNLSRVSILNMESGRHRPSVDQLFFLCGIFKCQITDLFPPIKAVEFTFEEKNVKVIKKVRKIKIVKSTK